jgi:formylglycine-generating enzyme required for sulfatase activity
MAVVSRCPNTQQLQQLLLGRLGEEAAEGLEQHVGQCGHCSGLLPRLPAEDTLVEAMRAQAMLTLHPADRKAIQDLLPRLHQLRTATPLPRGNPTGPPTAAEPSAGNTTLALLDFLRPPRTPDEIGRLGPYRILKLLGQGGMGVVFLADDPQLRRTVALKVLRPDAAGKPGARERFLREARAAAMLEDDHIVTIYQVGEDRGVPFLAMQLLKGMSLEDLLKKREDPGTPLPLDQILKFGRELAKGLAAAHEKGLIHRDIKPANIWLDATAGGRVKIVDFGLARPAARSTRLTHLGTILGTPAYMAPEQASSAKIDGRADLFSLGCVLYQLCTGRLPWKAGDAVDTLVAMAREEPIPVGKLNSALPPKLGRLVMQLLAKKPEDRPQSARAVVEAIEAVEREYPQRVTSMVLADAAPAVAAPADAWQDLTEAIEFVTQNSSLRTPPRPSFLRRLSACAGLTALVLVAVLLYLRTDLGVRLGRVNSPVVLPSREAPDTPLPGPVKSLTNSIGLKLVFIPPGKFLMGSSAREIARFKKEPFGGYVLPGWDRCEGPQHEVRIARGFYLGVYEVTQGQFASVLGKNPSANKESPEHPVEQVLWAEAMAFCSQLSDLSEEKKEGRVYRLPTEAEWEYACRAGTTTAFHCGESLSSKQANIDANNPFGTAEKGPQRGKTVRVGSYPPNAWGLHDMYGNVYEWCLDGQRSYTAEAVEDPRGPEVAGGDHVLRGGGWRRGACRSAYRKERGSYYRVDDCGFRVVCLVAARSAAGDKKPRE